MRSGIPLGTAQGNAHLTENTESEKRSDPLKGSLVAHGGNPQDRTNSPRASHALGNADQERRDFFTNHLVLLYLVLLYKF